MIVITIKRKKCAFWNYCRCSNFTNLVFITNLKKFRLEYIAKTTFFKLLIPILQWKSLTKIWNHNIFHVIINKWSLSILYISSKRFSNNSFLFKKLIKTFCKIILLIIARRISLMKISLENRKNYFIYKI